MGNNNTIAFYLRLSMADGDLGKDNKDESNSIENQRLLLNSFVDGRDDLDGEITEYSDDGYTGTNFERPAFKRLVDDAKKGKVQVLLVKDISRLGRDYIGVGDYIEQIFPLLGVRFIAVNNNFDSAAYGDGIMGLDLAVSNLVNHMYSRDISKKLRSALEVKWKRGCATNANVIYGYQWDKNSKDRWVIDPVSSKYVRRLFDLALEGKRTSQIAFVLNEEDIPTPGLYAKMKHRSGYYKNVAPDSEQLWDTVMVRRILKMYEYTGALVMGKRQLIALGKKTYRSVPKEDWIVKENAHEAIVTHEEFETAQEVIARRREPEQITDLEYPLKGKVRCGNCRRVMVHRSRDIGDVFYCRHKDMAGKYSKCYGGSYMESTVNTNVAHALGQVLRMSEFLENRITEEMKDNTITVKLTDVKKMESELDILTAERVRQYEGYAEGVITREEYIRKKNTLSEKIEGLQKEISRTEEQMQEDKDILNGVRSVNRTAIERSGESGLTAELADAFIESVYLYDGDRMEIVFKCENVINEAMDYCTAKTNGVLVM